MTHVIAHRGASAARPENTVEAFRHAVELGADAVEFDVRRSRDGVLVVCHDATYVDGRLVGDIDAADRPESICGLEEAVHACDDLLVNVEIKNLPGDHGYEADEAITDAVVESLDSLGRPERFLISSFNLRTIDRVRELSDHLATAFLTFAGGLDPASVFALARSRGHLTVHPHDAQVDRSYVESAHAAGLTVNVWTVDDPARITELGLFGIDGIVTNRPDVARSCLP